MTIRATIRLLLLLFLLLLSSCATMQTRTASTDYDDSLYPATQQDLDWITDDDIHFLGRTLMLADVPLSFISDTVLIPYDLLK
ncbi:MAG: YceK/YidQ family lipoprotein [Candidatus Dadabacteria bacterium]|nr:MAG: YceK/YidQ family lipoprotein [Candidatus Dadabacteria bacterium]